jgi:rubrerythrin
MTEAKTSKTFGSVDEVLDFAIQREEEAHQFYADLSGRMEQPRMKEIFEQFAKEESGHKAKLEGIKAGKRMLSSERKIMDLKMADYLVAGDTKGDMDYQQALILAMKKEKRSFRLYNDLAGRVDDEGLKKTFLGLAQEEAKHKLRFELEYDDEVLQEN